MSNDDHEISPDQCVWSHATASLATSGDGAVDLDVAWLVPADLSAVDALARLQLAASRRGRRLRLHGADDGLVELLEFVGLGDVVQLCPWCPSLRRPARAEDRTDRTARAPGRRESR
jgi:ABC-type transporter Mla MlaB component